MNRPDKYLLVVEMMLNLSGIEKAREAAIWEDDGKQGRVAQTVQLI